MPLKDFIQMYFNGSQIALADAMGVNPQSISRWVKGDFLVIGGQLFAPPKHSVPTPNNAPKIDLN